MNDTKIKIKRVYNVPVLSKALDIFELLQAENAPVSLEWIYRKTEISKATVYRIVNTFVNRGYLARTENGLYRFVARPRKVRFGFGSQSAEMPFSDAVTQSLQEAAVSGGVELLVLDNRYDGPTAIKNAEEFVRSKVDLVIEFQIDEQAAPVIADKIAGAGIPLIAVDIPHPHATFFGVDNFRVGFEAGELLANHAIQHWKGKVNFVVGLDLQDAGALVQARTTGAFEGVRSKLPDIPPEKFIRIDTRGMRRNSYCTMHEFLQRHPRDGAILVAAVTDTSALGALEAVRQLKRDNHVAIVGQDCLPEALDQLALPRSPLIGTVSHEATTYGPQLIQLGLALLRGELIPPYNYVAHRLVTADSLHSS